MKLEPLEQFKGHYEEDVGFGGKYKAGMRSSPNNKGDCFLY